MGPRQRPHATRDSCYLVEGLTATLKLYMSKAYDRVEWPFIEHMSIKLSFFGRFIQLIMMCVTLASYKVWSNGLEIGPIIPQRGLRQGDSISPYLFLICAEGLSSLLDSEARRGNIHGCCIARSTPVINHIFFVDDSFLFFKADAQESHCVKHCLTTYAYASG